LRVPLAPRSTTEAHRATSQLELLFDLTFVIAVARITLELAHAIAEGHAVEGIVPFLQVFFAIWWAWMNFTWFSSAYDNDDALYRLLTMLQMAGVLVLAVGVPAALDHGDYGGITLGYLIMRVGLVALWVRAAVDCPSTRATALRYAAGITALEVLWVLRLVLAERGALAPGSLLPVFVVLVGAELAVPWWAERANGSDRTSWHPHHIAERYGLFVIILLGECLLATAAGVTTALEGGAMNAPVLGVAVSGFILTMSLWWIYFLENPGDGLARHRDRSFQWGYGHYGVFASLAAFGAGLEVAAESPAGLIGASALVVSGAVAVPVAVFLVVVALVNAPLNLRTAVSPTATLAAVAVVLTMPLASARVGSPAAIAAIGATCVILAASASVSGHRDGGVNRPTTFLRFRALPPTPHAGIETPDLTVVPSRRLGAALGCLPEEIEPECIAR
jgi:low temperature requirement protein LtrA